jgi:hypothetical protein
MTDSYDYDEAITVADLRDLLDDLPDDAVVMVRIQNDPEVNPGPEGYVGVTHAFYTEADNSLNLE